MDQNDLFILPHLDEDPGLAGWFTQNLPLKEQCHEKSCSKEALGTLIKTLTWLSQFLISCKIAQILKMFVVIMLTGL